MSQENGTRREKGGYKLPRTFNPRIKLARMVEEEKAGRLEDHQRGVAREHAVQLCLPL